MTAFDLNNMSYNPIQVNSSKHFRMSHNEYLYLTLYFYIPGIKTSGAQCPTYLYHVSGKWLEMRLQILKRLNEEYIIGETFHEMAFWRIYFSQHGQMLLLLYRPVMYLLVMSWCGIFLLVPGRWAYDA